MDKKHRGSIWWITILIAGLLLLLCSGMILRGISSIAQLFRTFLLGIMIAFVLDQPSKLIQNALTKKANWREKPAKAVGILGAYLFIFALLAAVVGIVIPQMIDSVRTFALNMDAYLNNLQQELDRITIPLGVQRIDLSNLIDLAHAGLGKMDAAVVPHILSVTGTMLQALGTLAISIAFSVYLLAGKERILSQGNRVLRAYLPKQTYEQTHSVVRVIVDCFRNYLIGQTTEAIILGSLCFVGMLILGLEYAGVVSVTVGVTAMIPILGAYIGGVVAVILLFMIAPWKALVFLIFFVILQQVSDVSERCRAEQGVHNRMRQHIRVAVSAQSFGIGDLYAADDARSALYQTVYVIAVTNSHFCRLPFKIASPCTTSSGVVILMFS